MSLLSSCCLFVLVICLLVVFICFSNFGLNIRDSHCSWDLAFANQILRIVEQKLTLSLFSHGFGLIDLESPFRCVR